MRERRVGYTVAVIVAVVTSLVVTASGGPSPTSMPSVHSFTGSTGPIQAELIDKAFDVINSGNSVSFTVAFTNCGGKSVNHIRGDVHFVDTQSKVLFSMKVDWPLDEKLEPGQVREVLTGLSDGIPWFGSQRNFYGGDFYLPNGNTTARNTFWGIFSFVGGVKQQDLYVEFVPRSISYTNGTMNQYLP